MSCLGGHFALSEKNVAALQALDDEQERLSFLQEELEERYFAEPKMYVAESDKLWNAMHRALSCGKLSWDGGSYPLNHTVLGSRLLYSDNDYIMSLKTPQDVQAIAFAVENRTQTEFRKRYDQIDSDSYDGEVGDEDFEYTWEWFQGVRKLYLRAAAEKRHALFTEDQQCAAQQCARSDWPPAAHSRTTLTLRLSHKLNQAAS